MKKIKNAVLFVFAATILALGCNEAPKKIEEESSMKMDHHQTESKNAMMQAMDQSMLAMHNVKQTGNADYDFAAMMIPHHDGAILMAEELIKQGKSVALISFSEKVIVAQKAEVKVLQEFLEKAPKNPSKNAGQFKAALDGSMKPMMEGMKEAVVNGSIEHDFVVLMIPHHQSAVAMAQAYLPYAENLQIKRIAEEIIKAQEAEIKWLKEQNQ